MNRSAFIAALLGAAGMIIAFAFLARERAELAPKAAKFDDYCQSVRATAGVVLTDLDNEKWRANALERFSSRVDDFNRCATRVLSWEPFTACKLRGDQPCIATFVRETRDAIPVTQ